MASLMRPALLRQACQPSSRLGLSALTQQTRPAFRSAIVKPSTRIAAFHATQRQQILPPLPQKIQGTLNDPVPVPTPEYAHGSYHWTFER
jgi:succinate dehydrogenase (ubiquinone) membrane anchor subunit